jgi:galactokinase
MHQHLDGRGTNETCTIGEAPGRVNLIGEHTDYNGGLVLPTVIPQKTRVELTKRSDRLARVWSSTYSTDALGVEYELGTEAPREAWIDYVQGVTWAIRLAGHEIGGFDARVASAVPAGSGLSSSAALEISLLRALRQAFDLEISDVGLARLGQQAENEFVGARVGIMDQMAASLGDASTALFLDTRNLKYRRVPLPLGADFLVIHSGITHNNASGEYNRRRDECERACRQLGVTLLRECSLDDLDRISELPEPLCRRARHVVTENARVLDAVQAMERNDVAELGRLFAASHASMRDDYDVSIAEIDALVEIAEGEEYVFGARMTGGGFGGSIIALTAPNEASSSGLRILEAYGAKTGRLGRVFVPPPGHEAQ